MNYIPLSIVVEEVRDKVGEKEKFAPAYYVKKKCTVLTGHEIHELKYAPDKEYISVKDYIHILNNIQSVAK